MPNPRRKVNTIHAIVVRQFPIGPASDHIPNRSWEFARRRLRRKLPVRAVEKAPVGENLSVPEAHTHEEQGDFEWGPSPIGVPPIGEVRTDGQCEGLEGEECDEKADVPPKQTRNLGGPPDT